MTRQRRLRKSFSAFNKSVAKDERLIPGEMGVLMDGRRQVLVPNREPFVYVRLRSNPSEIVQAFNDKVSPSYKLPVLLKRDGNRYIVFSRDTQRYNDWEDENPFLPRHGDTHSFDKDGQHIGSDPVFVYPYQFMPSLVSPFGQFGAENVFIFPIPIVNTTGWKYTGNTGTRSLTQYNPASGSTILLISLDTVTGNPYILSTTGTYIPESVTGVAQIIPYLPNTQTTRYLPLSAVRLVSGTSSISWNNIYDVRQFISPASTGTSGIAHNDLAGLQGGSTGSYFHLTQSEHSGLVGGLPTALHSHSGTSGGDVIFEADGHIAVITGSSLPFLVTKPMTIHDWYIYLEYKGLASGTTIVDVNLIRTGTYNTLFPTQANRPMLNWNDSDGWAKAGAAGILNFLEGDILSPDIDQIATGAYGLVIVGKVDGAGTPPSLLFENASGTTSIPYVNRVVVPNNTLTDLGGGGVRLSVGSMVLLEQHTGSNSSSLDFTNCVSSNYDEYMIEIIGLKPATNTTDLYMRMSTDGGATFETGTSYSYDHFVWRTGGSATGGATAQRQIVMSYNGSSDHISNAASGEQVNGKITLFTPLDTVLFKVISGRMVYRDTAGPFRVANELRGAYESTSPINAFRFLMSSGNIESGTIRVYGVRK